MSFPLPAKLDTAIITAMLILTLQSYKSYGLTHGGVYQAEGKYIKRGWIPNVCVGAVRMPNIVSDII